MTTIAPSLKKGETNRDTRFFARISSSDKSLIEQAAVIAGQSTAAFVISQAREAAQRLFQEQQVLRLDRKESELLVKALLSPPKPANSVFKSALQDYRQSVVSDANPKSPVRHAKRASGKKVSRN